VTFFLPFDIEVKQRGPGQLPTAGKPTLGRKNYNRSGGNKNKSFIFWKTRVMAQSGRAFVDASLWPGFRKKSFVVLTIKIYPANREGT